MGRIPDLPGQLVERGSAQDVWLRGHVANLCGLPHDRFPGAQPVSFAERDLDRLVESDYWVCEKSDGVRVLLVILTNEHTGEQLVHLVDRHNSYRRVEGIYFPHFDNPARPLRSTIIDSELVIDVDPATGQETLRLLCFDCLITDGTNIMNRSLEKRYGRLKIHFFDPYAKMKQEHPEVIHSHPFDIKVKEVNLSYHLDKVFKVDIPRLQHGNDGLIYTPVATPYVPGTDKNILKWKPPSENSIDFKLVLRFPPTKGPGRRNEPDFHARPIFALHVWAGGSNYEPYDTMHVTDEEWETMKASGDQYDERVVEVHWDAELESWRMMRFRDDKPHGNHKTTVENIISSIADGVEKDVLVARSNQVRDAWKARHTPGARPPPPSGAPPPRQAPPPLQPAAAVRSVPSIRRFGPLRPSPMSKVGGPAVYAGFRR
ncbi:unnamed protein product [Peniophora sp. CBMAI 1063]|nr:unnamed protein product [Peniophora sp. CBMAI 1063]